MSNYKLKHQMCTGRLYTGQRGAETDPDHSVYDI